MDYLIFEVRIGIIQILQKVMVVCIKGYLDLDQIVFLRNYIFIIGEGENLDYIGVFGLTIVLAGVVFIEEANRNLKVGCGRETKILKNVKLVFVVQVINKINNLSNFASESS